MVINFTVKTASVISNLLSDSCLFSVVYNFFIFNGGVL